MILNSFYKRLMFKDMLIIVFNPFNLGLKE